MATTQTPAVRAATDVDEALDEMLRRPAPEPSHAMLKADHSLSAFRHPSGNITLSAHGTFGSAMIVLDAEASASLRRYFDENP